MDCCVNKQVRLEDWMPVIRESLAAGQSVVFSPRGTSMLPMLRQGVDRVELSPLPEKLKKYDLPLYQRENGQYVLHRILAVGDEITCMGDNQYVAETGLQKSQMIGLVTAFYRGKRKIPVTDPSYRLYCRVWHYTRPIRRGFLWLISKLRRH